jgi:hypothetical protein
MGAGGPRPQVEKVREEVKQLITLREQQESKLNLLQKQVSLPSELRSPSCDAWRTAGCFLPTVVHRM